MQSTRLWTAIRNVISRSPNSKSSQGWTLPPPASEQRSLSAEEIVRRGQKAQELQDNDLFREALQALRNDLISQITASSLSDKDGHTRLVMAVQMAGAVERYLRNVIHDGDAAM